MGKAFKGYFRRDKLVFLRGRIHRVYRQCDLMGGDGYGEKDLSAILFMARHCTDKEIEIALTLARTHGLRTLRHVRGIILKNRAAAVEPNLESIGLSGDTRLCTEVKRWAHLKYPDARGLRELYSMRIRNIVRGRNKNRFAWDDLNEHEEPDDIQIPMR